MPRQSFRSFRGFLFGTSIFSRWNGGPATTAVVMIDNKPLKFSLRKLAPAKAAA